MADPTDSAPLTPEQEAARRRRALVVAISLIAAVAVLATVTVLLLRSSGNDDDPPGSATATPTTASTSAGSSTAGTSSSPPTGATSSGAPVPTTIPPGLLLPHEGQPGWTASGEDVALCAGAVPATGASDRRRVQRGPNGEDFDVEVLVVFPTADAAVAYYTALEQAAQGCVTTPAAGTTSKVQPLTGSFAAGFAWFDASVPPAPGANYVLAARKGSAVTISGGFGEWQPSATDPDPAAIAQYRSAVDAMAAKMCVFTVAGC